MLHPVARRAGLLLLAHCLGCRGEGASAPPPAPIVVIPAAPPAASTAPAPDPDPPQRQALSGASLFPGDKLHAPLNLLVKLDDTGFTLFTSSGPIAPGCAGLGPGTTIARVNGEPDFKRLTVCARRLKSARPDLTAETDAGITASPGIPYMQVIETIDALRDEGGEPLFPDIHFMPYK